MRAPPPGKFSNPRRWGTRRGSRSGPLSACRAAAAIYCNSGTGWPRLRDGTKVSPFISFSLRRAGYLSLCFPIRLTSDDTGATSEVSCTARTSPEEKLALRDCKRGPRLLLTNAATTPAHALRAIRPQSALQEREGVGLACCPKLCIYTLSLLWAALYSLVAANAPVLSL